MNKERFKALLKMGFTVDEAFGLLEDLPDPKPDPKPEQKPDPKPEQKPEQKPDEAAPAWFEKYAEDNKKRFDDLEKRIQGKAVQGAESDKPETKSFDDIMREAYDAIR